ncbi:MAG: hypothetical protein IPL12_17000 [Bacteroidetes bacterium]|nr:hypothetical protein [Bacteroidota bacterium]
MEAAKAEIVKNYGDKYSNRENSKQNRRRSGKPTKPLPNYMEKCEVDADFDEKRLYKLIQKRTMASQMADAELEKTVVDIDISSRKENLVAKGEIIKLTGFFKSIYRSA